MLFILFDRIFGVRGARVSFDKGHKKDLRFFPFTTEHDKNEWIQRMEKKGISDGDFRKPCETDSECKRKVNRTNGEKDGFELYHL
jgi:hypothetical protein